MQNGLIDLPNPIARQILSEDFARSYKAYRKAENSVRTCPNDQTILEEFRMAQSEFFTVRDIYNNTTTEEI
jgi:hypothetical protein